MWIRDMELVSGNIDCKRKHFVLEKKRSGEYVMMMMIMMTRLGVDRVKPWN